MISFLLKILISKKIVDLLAKHSLKLFKYFVSILVIIFYSYKKGLERGMNINLPNLILYKLPTF